MLSGRGGTGSWVSQQFPSTLAAALGSWAATAGPPAAVAPKQVSPPPPPPPPAARGPSLAVCLRVPLCSQLGPAVARLFPTVGAELRRECFLRPGMFFGQWQQAKALLGGNGSWLRLAATIEQPVMLVNSEVSTALCDQRRPTGANVRSAEVATSCSCAEQQQVASNLPPNPQGIIVHAANVY